MYVSKDQGCEQTPKAQAWEQTAHVLETPYRVVTHVTHVMQAWEQTAHLLETLHM